MLSAMLYDTLIKYLSLFFIKMDKEDTRLFLESSPQYPNLLSVMQTLEYIKFDAKVGKCSWDYLKNLESPFLLHISINTQEILIISKWNNRLNSLKIFNLINNRWETKGKEYFENTWDGIVIYTNTKVIRNSYLPEKKFLFSIFIITFVLFIIIKQWGYSLIYALPIIISLIISLSIYWRKNISNIKLVEKLCYRSFISDCNVVENSPYSSWKGLSMNNLALSFFVSQFICIIISFTLGIYNVLNTIYLISAIVFIPISFYSIYSQIQIKKICPLCLIILTCVFTETLMSIYMLKSPASIGVLIMWGFIN